MNPFHAAALRRWLLCGSLVLNVPVSLMKAEAHGAQTNPAPQQTAFPGRKPAASGPEDVTGTQSGNNRVRVALGRLGLTDSGKDGVLTDLVTAELGSASDLELVERNSLDRALKEAELSLSGMTRAKDAIRVGRLLRADWFVLGTSSLQNGTNLLLIRIVDTRASTIRDLAAFINDGKMPELATKIAGFLRHSHPSTSGPGSQLYLAIGGFEDLSINNRLTSFPDQLRASLAADFKAKGIVLVERQLDGALLNEVRLD